ncbi:hypothetical protein [uncultured Tateyamaria sp.]|uniref:hypothetical protein n=1 Tax=uncultured Tateyamaria sp. TaxID=455651 RepID=UPI0026029381|nr:hypothetical protein [uncultured Tateyamaria sp.]
MWKYDGLTYPDVGVEMLKHKKLGPILRAHMKAQLMAENYLFIDAMGANMKTKTIYDRFIDSSSAEAVNISHTMREPMIRAAEIGDFSSPIWVKSLKPVYREVNKLIATNIFPSTLVKNKAFRAYHNSRKWKNKANLINKYKLRKETKKVAKILDMELTADNFEIIAEAAAALEYEPKSALKPITLIANSSKKKQSANSVKAAIRKSFG